MRRLVVKQQQKQQSDGEEREQNDDVGDRWAMHLLPCKIRPDKVAASNQTLTGPVNRYFCPYEKGATTTGDTALWHASLRGKPLTGVKLDMPDGYVGVLCSSNGNQVDRGYSPDLVADQVTEQLTYWNWDRVPSRDDPLLAAFDWVRVSEAIMINDD